MTEVRGTSGFLTLLSGERGGDEEGETEDVIEENSKWDRCWNLRTVDA